MLQISIAKSVSHYDRFIAKARGLEPVSITVANAHTKHNKARLSRTAARRAIALISIWRTTLQAHSSLSV